MWDHNIQPKDSLHLATAIAAGVELFETYDRELLRKQELRVHRRKLVIREPAVDQMELDL